MGEVQRVAEEAESVADGHLLRRWARRAVDSLQKRRGEINSLNVFPIPDSDTGTNLLFTMRAALDSAETIEDDVRSAGRVANALARGAVSGARGNSGVILSQVIRGIAESVQGEHIDGRSFANSLTTATGLASRAVSDLVEGTIVTVLRASGEAAQECVDTRTPSGEDLASVVAAAADAAAIALNKTPEQLDVLASAGVVDAGGFGLVLILDAFVEVVTGKSQVREDLGTPDPRSSAVVDVSAFDHDWAHKSPIECGDHSEQDFEVMYLVDDSDDDRMTALRTRLSVLGDSTVIVSDGFGGWSVHVHCCDAGAAVEAGLEAGKVHGIRISSFLVDERDQLVARAERRFPGAGARGVLAVVAGESAAALFESEGATVLRCDDAPVTRAQLLGRIRQMERSEVLVLPNGALTAQELVAVSAAARDPLHQVLLLSTSSMVQGLAALAVHDAQRNVADDGFTMSEAAAATRWGSLRIAVERSLTYVGTCDPGDAIGLMGHEVVLIGPDVAESSARLVDLALGSGGELVTLLMGADAPDALAGQLEAHVIAHHPGVDVLVYQGDQPGDLFQLGVE
ncbi:dihydroxyacetone kinase [Rhodococcus sp. P27]|uniref:DAK2 domain-containing protein n=1 Tax=Rhodococcus erythropolis TaxID=1833 RepID=A0AAX3VDA1_RHOER|nr:DAK2 domain-containing protein [Rhodococcus erythropolis]ERB53221.1 dihydroxyacetone kinase [Rhodococcus sp. P27]WGV51938.2 DAK2 domain-containing protein [Rhodococcus erythropolis]